MSASRCPVDFHPLRWEDVEDPFEKLKAVRTACPAAEVSMDGLPPMTLVTRFDLASKVYRDHENFGNIGSIVNLAEHDFVPVEKRQIISSDPPYHGPRRRFALIALAPNNVDKQLPDVEAFARDLTAKLPRGEEFDLMDQWAGVIPSFATGRIVGLPDEEALEFRKWIRRGTEAMARKKSPSSPEFEWFEPSDTSKKAIAGGGGSIFPESADFVGRMIRARRADPDAPKDDVLGLMMHFKDAETGIAFPDDMIESQIVTIIAAGNDTTGGHIGSLVYRMLTEPVLWRQLKDDRTRIPRAIEESLRFDSPQQMFPRRVLNDIEIDGIAFKKDQVVIISIASCNRDEAVYGDDADRFDMDRDYPNPRHLAFGRGIHTCIGAYQARKISAIAINALLDAVDEMQIAPGYKYEKVLYHHFRAPQRLPVIIPR